MFTYDDNIDDFDLVDDDEFDFIDNKYIVFYLAGIKYAFPIANLLEITILPSNINRIHMNRNYYAGITKLRDSIIPLINLRILLNYKTIDEEADELIEMLKKREQDHKNWVDELDKSTHERREFKLTTDPHLCAFGKWYDAFKTDNLIVSTFLKKFDSPHKTIHGIGTEVNILKKQNKHSDAITLIDNVKDNELKLMIDLFNRLFVLLKENKRQILLVFEIGNQNIGYIVDNVENVLTIPAENIETNIQGNKLSVIKGIAKMESDTICLLSPEIEEDEE
ncbi:MAG: chemotaxis protein CheW [Candidatus Kapabacteria bacterium]|nr:chemotaxis protein CheW [Candidatus Kapabacteria bacterium]